MRSASNVSASKNRIALNTKEQCDLLESHGVEFKLCSKAEAESFLRNNTYFFKIKAFDKNFKRDQQGNYSKLDFAYLKDISTIDFKLRMLILRMTGDIEQCVAHSIQQLNFKSPRRRIPSNCRLRKRSKPLLCQTWQIVCSRR